MAKDFEREERTKLYEMQESLLEHKYPHNPPMMPEILISCAGDIFREISGRTWPAPMYLSEKLGTLKSYIATDADIEYFWWTVETQKKDNPNYHREVEIFLKNLERVHKATSVANISFDRKEAMLAALNMQWYLVKWFEKGPKEGWADVKRAYNTLSQKASFFYRFRGM